MQDLLLFAILATVSIWAGLTIGASLFKKSHWVDYDMDDEETKSFFEEIDKERNKHMRRP